MRNEGGGFAAILRFKSQLFWHSLSHIRRFSPLRMTKKGRCSKVACDWGLSRIVISSVSENFLPFAVRWSMVGNIKRETCSP